MANSLTISPTASPLAYDDHGSPSVYWECGLAMGKLTELPAFDVEIPLQGGGFARAGFPSAKRVLVDDPWRERVTMHFALAIQPRRFFASRKIACGVHVFAEERSDGFVGITVVPNWGTLDPKKPGSWPGAVRFQDIKIVLPSGWIRVGGSFGPAGDWYGGPRTWTSRRMAFVPKSGGAQAQSNALQWIALAGLQVNGHPSLGPARHKIPTMLYPGRRQPLGSGLGAGPLLTDRPTNLGYGQGGGQIIPEGGWEGSTGAARSYEGDVWRVLSGHPCAAFNASTGEPIRRDEWASVEPYPLTDGYLRFNPQSGQHPALGSLVGAFGWALQASGPKEFNPGPSASRYNILAIEKHDAAHMIRAIHILTAAWWYTRSWAAWLGLRMIAADIVTSQFLRGANQYLREQGWTRKGLATVIAILPPGYERDFFMHERDLALMRLAQTTWSNGWARAGAPPSSDNGEPGQLGMPPEYDTAAAWQLPIYMEGLYDLLRCGPLAAITQQTATWLLTEAASKLYEGPLIVQGSPPVHVGVTHNKLTEMPVTKGVGRSHFGHYIHEYHALTLAMLWTKDDRYKMLMERIGWPMRNATQLKTWWGSATDQQPEWTCIPRAYL